MKKLLRLLCVSATLFCLLIANAQFAEAKKSSSKKPSRGKVVRGKSSKPERGKKVSSRKGRQEISKRGGKKLSRRELAALAKKERRGRGKSSRRGRSYVARSNYPSRNVEALKVREEAPLHVGDEDPQPTTTQSTTTPYIAPTPAPAPRASGIPLERVIEIQTALLKAGYYQGETTGVYDDTTKQAMKQYQQANRLHASGLPSAHALKKLGVSKRKNDDYAVTVKSAKDKDQDKSSTDKEKNNPNNQ
jgi:hypothetical protein